MASSIDPFAFPDAAFDPEAHGPHAIVLGGGCFWCTEAVYSALHGVRSVMPGYAGDAEALADYETVCTGRTNHAEVIRIDYDADAISLGKILRLFFSIAHDPTERDRQGADIGRQYRSVIFHEDEAQREVAARYIAQLDAAHVLGAPIATELAPLTAFYPAEPYHHGYAARNPQQGYIRGVAEPKVRKLVSAFPSLLKSAPPR
jgi:peptide-methionine (S)-S-oxide reductase